MSHEHAPTPQEPANSAESPMPATATPEAAAGEDTATLLAQEVQGLKDRLLRATAEAENTRKRAAREVEEAKKYSVSAFAADMVNVAENLQRALSSVPAEERQSSICQGIDMTLKELLNTFARHGIRRIDPMGEKFDHNHHQAVAQIDAPSMEAGTVAQVLQAGYIIHDRLLKPAMVAVAKGKPQVDTVA